MPGTRNKPTRPEEDPETLKTEQGAIGYPISGIANADRLDSPIFFEFLVGTQLCNQLASTPRSSSIQTKLPEQTASRSLPCIQ